MTSGILLTMARLNWPWQGFNDHGEVSLRAVSMAKVTWTMVSMATVTLTTVSIPAVTLITKYDFGYFDHGQHHYGYFDPDCYCCGEHDASIVTTKSLTYMWPRHARGECGPGHQGCNEWECKLVHAVIDTCLPTYNISHTAWQSSMLPCGLLSIETLSPVLPRNLHGVWKNSLSTPLHWSIFPPLPSICPLLTSLSTNEHGKLNIMSNTASTQSKGNHTFWHPITCVSILWDVHSPKPCQTVILVSPCIRIRHRSADPQVCVL